MKKRTKGLILLILGTFLFSYQHISERKEIITEKNKVEYTIQKQVGYLKKDNIDIYDAILSIPQIKLKKGIYKKEDKRNNIEENVTIHEKSDYPDQENSNVILMAHSGNSKKSFFKDLNQLNSDSLVELYYNNTKYVYKIEKYITQEKSGILSIDKKSNTKTITLITCSQIDKSKQLIYIGNIIDEIKYTS